MNHPQITPFTGFAQKAKIPPTAVGGWFKSLLQESAHENSGNPPNGSLGIVQVRSIYLALLDFGVGILILHMNRVDLNDPCTAVQGIH